MKPIVIKAAGGVEMCRAGRAALLLCFFGGYRVHSPPVWKLKRVDGCDGLLRDVLFSPSPPTFGTRRSWEMNRPDIHLQAVLSI
jgi:hypothetical protein